MDDYAVVLNAGSSSLKFGVYRRAAGEAWGLAASGQVDGIGVSPRFVVKSGTGERMADDSLDKTTVRDGRSALTVLAEWLRAQWGGARVLGVGHRVVTAVRDCRTHSDHAGSRGGAARIHSAGSRPPAAQSGRDRGRLERLPDVQVACFDTSFHRGHAEVAELVPLPRDATPVCSARFHGLA
jgi:acetate kinase